MDELGEGFQKSCTLQNYIYDTFLFTVGCFIGQIMNDKLMLDMNDDDDCDIYG